MSDEKKLNFNVSSEKEHLVLTVLEGEAEKIKYPQRETLQTTIGGPAIYFSKVGIHYPNVEKTAVAQVDAAKGQVILTINATDSEAAIVTGSIRVNKDLEAFKINNDTARFTGEELAKLILNKSHVIGVSPKEVKVFANKFKNFSANVTKSIEKEKDDVGNILDNFVQKVTSENIPTEVPFNAMLHVGSPKHEFTVNVGLESTGRNIVFYLYSPEYTAALQEEKEALIQEQTSDLKSLGVCVVETF